MTSSAKRYGVTEEQIDACTCVIQEGTGETFYLVQSATDLTVTYQVRYNRQFNHLTCQCKAGQNGSSCWHMRAVLAHHREYVRAKQAEAIAREHQERLETLKRVMNAKPFNYTTARRSTTWAAPMTSLPG